MTTTTEAAPDKITTINDFINEYHPGLTHPAICYALKNKLIDGEKVNGRWEIKLTPNTLGYRPVRSGKRLDKMNTQDA